MEPIAAWREVRADDPTSEAELDARIDAVCASVAPIEVDREALARAMARLDGPLAELDAACELARALACARGDEAALGWAERELITRVRPAVAHLRLDGAAIRELEQEVRTRLLVRAGDEPARIVGYAGKGRLGGLVKVIAVRAALDRLEALACDAPGDVGLERAPSPEQDPELAYLDAHYRAAFARAFEDAARSLERRERNWLRLHLLSGAGLEEIARMYGVHRATVVRTLAKARQHLLEETRKGMRRELGIGLVELDSIMRLVGSRLDASVARVLRASSAAHDDDA